MFGLASENLTKRLRSQAFKAMLHQEIGNLNFSIGYLILKAENNKQQLFSIISNQKLKFVFFLLFIKIK